MTKFERPRLRRVDAAEYLAEVHGFPIAIATLAKLASVGGGPRMEYAGRFPLYPKSELDAWAESKISKPVSSTSERGLA